MKPFKTASYLLIFLLSFFLFSCKTDQDKDGVVDGKDLCKDTKPDQSVDECGCSEQQILDKTKLSQISFYIETSASMAGYMRGETDFLKRVPGLIISSEKGIEDEKTNTKTKIYKVSNKEELFVGDGRAFNNQIATFNLANSESSPIDLIIERIGAKLDTASLAVFVSDCILSGTNEQIRTNPNFNVEKINTTLKNNLKNSFGKLSNKGYAAEVYGFTSRFNGTYFTNTNQRIENPTAERPYYIWFIGKKEVINKYKRGILKNATDLNDHVFNAQFGFTENPLTVFDMPFNKYKTPADMRVKNGEITDIEIPKNGPATFAIVADLSKLPIYAQDLAFLRNNIKFEGAEGEFRVIAVENSGKLTSKDLAKGKEISNQWLIKVAMGRLVPNECALKVVLPRIADNSYQKLSSLDDSNANLLNATTFGFAAFIEGVQEAYNKKNAPNYFEFLINLKR